MNESFSNMIGNAPEEAWEQWKSEKSGESFGEAKVVIAIAKWRAKDIIKRQAHEDMLMDEWIRLKDMLSGLKLENGYLFNPRKEKGIIKALNSPSRLRNKFRSATLDRVLRKIIDESVAHHQGYISIRHKIFPYIPK